MIAKLRRMGPLCTPTHHAMVHHPRNAQGTMYRCRSCNGARQCSVQSQRVTPSTTRRSPFRFCGRTNHKIPSLSKFLCLVPGVQYSIVQERFSILASAKPALSRLSRISAKISQELGPNSCRRFTTLISTMSIALRPSNPTSVATLEFRCLLYPS